MKPDLIIQNHCIDDQATTADLALEQFRCAFPYTVRLNVWDGGMTYEFRKVSNIESVIEKAKEIIKLQNLPLVVKTYKNYRSEYFLMIEFKIKKESAAN